MKSLLGFTLALASAICLDSVLDRMSVMTFENPDPPYWATFGIYWRVSALLVPAIFVVLTMERHGLGHFVTYWDEAGAVVLRYLKRNRTLFPELQAYAEGASVGNVL